VIVLDEQLKNAGLEEQISRWYRGRVVNITSLRPSTVIKDDAIPLLLRQGPDSTFVTINIADFWRRVAPDRQFCMACFLLPDERVTEVSDLLRRLFRLSQFKSKQARRGKIIRVSQTQVQFYAAGDDNQVHLLAWPEP